MMKRAATARVREETQQLLRIADHSVGGAKNLAETFRRLYFRLYSNSSSSRAERLLENLATLLLLKFSLDKLNGDAELQRFLFGKITAATLLKKFLSRQLPAESAGSFSFSISDDSIRDAMQELAHVDLSIAPAHILGEAFQALIGPRLRGDKGQFFTPKSLVRAMVRITRPQPNESILDPACGTGGFLGEAHVYQHEAADDSQVNGRLVGIEKDPDLARLSTALMHIGTGGRCELLNANSLDVNELKTKGFDEVPAFDVVLTNPPFGTRIPIEDRAILRTFDLAHAWINRGEGSWSMSPAVLTSQDPQILFIERCVRLLRDGGRMGIVLPEGVFGNKQDGYVWAWLRQQGRITALLDCPRTTFQPSTDTKTNVLFFTKEMTRQQKGRGKVFVGVALRCGHDRRGRTHRPDGTAHDDDFDRLGRTYGTNGSKSLWSSVVIGETNYLVPRYYVRDQAFSDSEKQIIEGAALSTIGDLMKLGILALRKGHEVGSHAYGTGDIPFVRTSDVNNLEISTDPTNGISDDVFEEYRTQQALKPGDVLMVVDGRYRIGATAILSENNFRCVVQSHFRIISSLQPGKLSPYELLYALNLPSVRIRIRDLVFVQSTLGTLGARLLELEIPILHGSGPWRARVDRFADVLGKRDALLAQMQEMAGPEVEL